jgi:hypothetical protein
MYLGIKLHTKMKYADDDDHNDDDKKMLGEMCKLTVDLMSSTGKSLLHLESVSAVRRRLTYCKIANNHLTAHY